MQLQIDLICRHLADPGCLEALLEGRRDPVLGREGHGDSGGRNGRPERKIFVMKGEKRMKEVTEAKKSPPPSPSPHKKGQKGQTS